MNNNSNFYKPYIILEFLCSGFLKIVIRKKYKLKIVNLLLCLIVWYYISLNKKNHIKTEVTTHCNIF